MEVNNTEWDNEDLASCSFKKGDSMSISSQLSTDMCTNNDSKKFLEEARFGFCGGSCFVNAFNNFISCLPFKRR